MFISSIFNITELRKLFSHNLVNLEDLQNQIIAEKEKYEITTNDYKRKLNKIT